MTETTLADGYWCLKNQFSLPKGFSISRYEDICSFTPICSLWTPWNMGCLARQLSIHNTIAAVLMQSIQQSHQHDIRAEKINIQAEVIGADWYRNKKHAAATIIGDKKVADGVGKPFRRPVILSSIHHGLIIYQRQIRSLRQLINIEMSLSRICEGYQWLGYVNVPITHEG